MNSINFVKKRIDEGCANLDISRNAKWHEIDFKNKFTLIGNTNTLKEFSDNNKFRCILKTSNGNVDISIQCDKNADFEYFTMEQCVCDGTLLFAEELFAKILNKLVKAETVNKVKFTRLPYGGEIKYTVGDFVFCEEFGKFSTDEKPWLNSRFTVMLPIKFDVDYYKN